MLMEKLLILIHSCFLFVDFIVSKMLKSAKIPRLRVSVAHFRTCCVSLMISAFCFFRVIYTLINIFKFKIKVVLAFNFLTGKLFLSILVQSLIHRIRLHPTKLLRINSSISFYHIELTIPYTFSSSLK